MPRSMTLFPVANKPEIAALLSISPETRVSLPIATSPLYSVPRLRHSFSAISGVNSSFTMPRMPFVPKVGLHLMQVINTWTLIDNFADMKADIAEKMDKIREAMAQKRNVLVAFSGGVDSSVVASLAYDALAERASAITIDSGLSSPGELEDAKRVASKIGIPHKIMKLDILAHSKFVENPPDRCYHCKKRMLLELRKIAGANIIVDGTNASDIGEDRPGRKALKEFGVFTPLLGFGVSKSEVREMAVRLNLPNANKPSESCLATRIPCGQKVTKEKIRQIREAEEFLRSKGIADLRVRHHGNSACIEISRDDMQHILTNAEEVIKKFREIGFRRISHKLRV